MENNNIKNEIKLIEKEINFDNSKIKTAIKKG